MIPDSVTFHLKLCFNHEIYGYEFVLLSFYVFVCVCVCVCVRISQTIMTVYVSACCCTPLSRQICEAA